jgi:hypothetical protein
MIKKPIPHRNTDVSAQPPDRHGDLHILLSKGYRGRTSECRVISNLKFTKYNTCLSTEITMCLRFMNVLLQFIESRVTAVYRKPCYCSL